MSDAPQSVSAPGARELPIEFRATGGEYFRIWIVNLLLSIVTLGIYSAWAKVRRLRYFYGSTVLDGSSFEYHGRPIAILKGRIVVVGGYLVFIGLSNLWPLANFVLVPLVIFGVPWVVVRAHLFQMRMTAWRGLRFNFLGQYEGALGAYVGWAILAAITLFILWPLALWKQVNFIASNTAFGAQRFTFHTTKGRFYEFCFVALGMMVGVVVVVFMALALIGLTAMVTAGVPAPGSPPDAAALVGAILSIAAIYIGSQLVGAYFRASFINASIGGITVGPHRIVSRLKFLPLLGIFVTNLLGMIVTLGLFYPWAKVRMLRYQLANTSLQVEGDLGQFIADSKADPAAVGEEAADFFDIDFGI